MRTVKASSILLALLLLTIIVAQISCQTQTKASVLVIAVDDLSVLDVLCNTEESPKVHQSGLEILCKESVRFTHAFNTSPMSVPTLTSLLTGLYPFQHMVRNNGAPGLDPRFVTVAENALNAKYRTGFFSGGPPVWRKSGLNQGFELFDDSIIPTRHSLYRNFEKTSSLFLQWLKNDVGSAASFFSVIYVPDLIFTNTVTVNEAGEARNLSHESQLDEFDSNLFKLFKELKNQNRWHDTTIVVVGLNGHTDDDRPGELGPSNLHSENTQVALFIKPQQKRRDMALQWKIDRNVSLADVGETLFSLVGTRENPNGIFEMFPTYSLTTVLSQPQPDWPENRLILLESDWPRWRDFGGRRTAVINRHILYIYDESEKIYNTLTDRFETNPIRSSEISVADREQILKSLDEVGAQRWSGYNKEILKKYSPAFHRWLRDEQKPFLLKDLRKKIDTKEPDSEVLKWAALLAFDLKDWGTLKYVGTKAQNEIWQFIAEKNSLGNPKSTFNFQQDPCLRIISLKKIDSADMKACDDRLFVEFIEWQRADLRGLSKNAQKLRFERAYLYRSIDQEIQEASLATLMIWDLAPMKALGPRLTDLVLSLPEYHKERAALYKSLQNSANWQDSEELPQ